MQTKAHHAVHMRKALALAQEAADRGEVPVGAVILQGSKIIGSGCNGREQDHDPTGHAEIQAIRQAAELLGSFRLENTRLYVTLEPCPMCAGAIVNARIPEVIFGCRDPKAGAVRTLYALLEDPRLNHRCAVVEGILADECAQVLSDFFSKLRKKRSS